LTGQIQTSDCIYIRGGVDEPLKNILSCLDSFGKLIKGKLVVGSSAGANILSKYYWRNSKNCIEEGLGILPIKVFCHYNETKKESFEQLKNHEEDLPVHTIPETEFIILER
jgi:peptidase E